MSEAIHHLRRRIDDQKEAINDKLSGRRVPDIATYYWGTAKLGAHGVCARPDHHLSLLPQLLMTPHLVVDIYPLPPKKFLRTYGLTPLQMRQLADEGFIIPNIYFYKNDRWQEYAKYPQISKLLVAHGRPNTEWITRYLEKAHGFAQAMSDNAEYLRALDASEEERQRILQATNGRALTWDAFVSAYGQRFAYIEVVGGDRGRFILDWIKRSLQQPGLQPLAIGVLNVSKHLLATEVTAAYGGKATFAPSDIREIRDFVPLLGELVPIRKRKAVRKNIERTERDVIPEAAAQYLQTILRRAAAWNELRAAGSGQMANAELDPAQFKAFRVSLRKVNDGRVGTLIDGMTATLTESESKYNLSLRQYKDIERELDAQLKPLAPIGHFLNHVGSVVMKFGRDVPSGTLPNWANSALLCMVGAAFMGWGIHLKTAEIAVPLWGKLPRRLCGDWRAVKNALELRAGEQ